jgi:hypothetical protein
MLGALKKVVLIHKQSLQLKKFAQFNLAGIIAMIQSI